MLVGLSGLRWHRPGLHSSSTLPHGQTGPQSLWFLPCNTGMWQCALRIDVRCKQGSVGEWLTHPGPLETISISYHHWVFVCVTVIWKDHAHLWLIPLDISPCHCSPVAELGWLLARPHCCSRVTMGTGTKYHQSSGLLFPLATLTPKQFWAHSMMIKYWHNRTLCWLLWPKHASKH